MRGSFPLFYKLMEGLTTWREVTSALGTGRSPIKAVGDLAALMSPEKQGEPVYVGLDASMYPLTYLHPYLARRRYDERVLQLGFDMRTSDHRDWKHRIILPYYDFDMRCVTYTGRSIFDEQVLRYKSAKGGETRRWLYGGWRLAYLPPFPRLWVVEGPFDVITLASLGEAAVALSGNQISARQALDITRLVALYGATPLLALDRGAEVAVRGIVGALTGLGTRPVRVDVGEVAKDPGTLTPAGLSHLLDRIGGTEEPVFGTTEIDEDEDF